jgi:NADP-dependent 3-hydroxy acid dehydrogenase YdfG
MPLMEMSRTTMLDSDGSARMCNLFDAGHHGGMIMASHASPSPAVALVTGGSSGIGFELAKCFAEEGHTLIIAAEDQDGLDRAAGALRMAGAPRVETVSVDLSRPDGGPKLYEAV